MSAVRSRPQGQLRLHFEYVPEFSDDFLALFPHRGDYLWADHVAPGQRPEWHTERRHLLSDRLILKGAHLYGVRFASNTRYLMLDIDPSSAYHPQNDEFATRRILDALEPIGLVSFVAVSSSYRGGIHLYFPFEKSQPSWKIALAASELLKGAGFTLAPGQLEIFPNPRGYSPESTSLYNGHRLPLQSGSYLLNDALEPTIGSHQTFVEQWRHAEQRNDLNQRRINRIAKQAKQDFSKVSRNARKFLADLDADIEPGWTDNGQTNYLLGRIAIREYVFRHAISGGEELTGQALADAIAQTARALPGYEDYCNHKHDLADRAAEWARCVETSTRYFPYGGNALKPKPAAEPPIAPQKLTWNQMKAQEARERVREAIADLLEKAAFPAQITTRRNALRSYGIGNTTLDKNRDLWHPKYLESPPIKKDQSTPVLSPESEQLEVNQEKDYRAIQDNKLFTELSEGRIERSLTPDEEDWLSIVLILGWLTCSDFLTALEYRMLSTDPEHFDWFVLSEFTTFLESDQLLSEVILENPVPIGLLQCLLDEQFAMLGWDDDRIEQFVLEECERSRELLAFDDLVWLVLSLRSGLI
jgi:hypothetical protein